MFSALMSTLASWRRTAPPAERGPAVYELTGGVLGSGTFGRVLEAVERGGGAGCSKVAIKQVRLPGGESDCRELQVHATVAGNSALRKASQ